MRERQRQRERERERERERDTETDREEEEEEISLLHAHKDQKQYFFPPEGFITVFSIALSPCINVYVPGKSTKTKAQLTYFLLVNHTDLHQNI